MNVGKKVRATKSQLKRIEQDFHRDDEWVLKNCFPGRKRLFPPYEDDTDCADDLNLYATQIANIIVAVRRDSLAYTTQGKDLEYLTPTFSGNGNVVGCLDYSDENWDRGVLLTGPLRLLVPNSPVTRRALEGAKSLILAPEKSIDIISYEVTGSCLIVNCGIESFDRKAFAAPAKFWTS